MINLKALNRLVNTEHFKMEGIHTVKDLLKPGDWLAKVDLKDAYFAIPIYTPNPLEVSQISSPRENVSLRVPTIRSVISPVGIHQNSEASLSPSSRNGHASSGLHRRHSDFGEVQGDGPRSCGSLSVSVGVPGLCNQHRKIRNYSEPDHRISGPDSRLSPHGASTPASKNENDSGGVPKIAEGTSYLSSHLSPSTGENECNSVCGSPGSSLLSPPAEGYDTFRNHVRFNRNHLINPQKSEITSQKSL